MVQSVLDYLKKIPNEEGKRHATMKPLTVILLFSTILFSATLNQKIIIDVTTEPQSSTYKLQEIQNLFKTNDIAKVLKLKNHLTITLRTLEGYDFVEIKPIHSIDVKNDLKLLLHKKYPEFFVVENTFRKKSVRISSFSSTEKLENIESNIKQECSTKSIVMQSKVRSNSLVKGILDEWLALIILAIIGLLLVYRSTRQISKIKKLQKKLEKYQNRLKTEVDLIGEQYE
jgi:hypothetical protein